MRWSPSGAARWRDAYDELTRPRPGLLGAVTSRDEAHSLRLAMIYAILDGSPEIGAEHVEAALAVWRYCADSAGMLFGRSTGDHKADVVIAALRAAPKGLTRSEIGQGVLSGHTSSKALGEILDRLVAAGIARRERVATDGRHAERYFADTSAEKA